MDNKVIDREMMYDIGRWLFDGLLLTVVWAKSGLTLLSQNALWTETFGEYASVIKTTVQVIITIIIAVTAFYRLLRERRRYKEGKKDKTDEN